MTVPAKYRDVSGRTFNGDAAICSKIFAIASEPLGEVVLTFFEEMPPPYMRQARRGVSGPIPSMSLTTLKERLEKANLKVTEWNLAKQDTPPKPEPNPGPDKAVRPQVLLVLPPPAPSPMPPMRGQPPPPQWGPQHDENLHKAIDDGMPAVFLATFAPPPQFAMRQAPSYVLGDYLKESWGVDVRTDLLVVQAEADPDDPGTYVLPVVRWNFMPLSTFTDHPVGKPLKARRLYWLNTCPVVKVKDSQAKTKIEDILAIPQGVRGIWAASNAMQLAAKVYTGRGRGIVPGSAEGDLTSPFSIVVQASKTAGEKTNSIIVLGVGLIYIDEVLNRPVPRLGAGETLATDPPPTGAVDLVINSVYHLIDKDEYIGAGPTLTPRIRHIPVGTMTVLKIVFGLVWPLALLGIGGIVMLARRR
ncbi:hypothetical protein LCGC14_1961310 [marine sediment metagenome]|uniref:Uncharacterized protein n=1 Tax=marine sediment metagenome TaxID=412755 RepID=A0A0F9G2X7_9ZZZZ